MLECATLACVLNLYKPIRYHLFGDELVMQTRIGQVICNRPDSKFGVVDSYVCQPPSESKDPFFWP